MPSSPGGIRVNPNGQSAVVTFTLPNGGTPVAYSSRSGAGTISLPATVTTETTFWFQEQTVLTVSALVGTQQSATTAGTTAAVDLSAGGVAGLLVAVVAASGGSSVARWTANTAYTAGTVVQSPYGRSVSAISTFTSGSTYNASNWTPLDRNFHVEEYGADPTGTADSSAAFLAAIAAASAGSGGGTVVATGKEYRWTLTGTNPLVLPARTIGTVNLRGGGRDRTRIRFYNDQATGTCAVKSDSTSGQFATISDINFYGPGDDLAAEGVLPCNMDGVEVAAGMRLYSVSATHWNAGFVNRSNHTQYHACSAQQNAHGLRFRSMVSRGDHIFNMCDFAGNTLSSIVITADGATMEGAVFTEGHLGVAPYCILIENGLAASALAVGSTLFLGTAFEGFTGGLIRSLDKGGSISKVQFLNCGIIPQASASTYITGVGFPGMFSLGQANDLRMVKSTPGSTIYTSAFLDCAATDVEIDQCDDLLTALNSAGKAFISGSPSAVRVSGREWRGEVRTNRGGSSLATGDLVARRPRLDVEKLTSSNLPAFCGVMMLPAANLAGAVFATGGIASATATGAVADGSYLIPDSSTPSSVTAVTTATTDTPIIGYAENSTSGAGLVPIYLTPGTPAVPGRNPQGIVTTKGDLLVRTATSLARRGVGSNGQVLTADSTDATGVKWAAASAAGSLIQTMRSGQYYGAQSTANNTANPGNNTATYVPIFVGSTCTVSAMRVRITTAGNTGATCRLAIYGDTNGIPGTLIAEAGSVAADAIAQVEVACSIALSPGTYWLAAAPQNAATTAPQFTSDSGKVLNVPTSNDPNTTQAGYSGGVAGAFPGTGGISGGFQNPIRVLIKIA